MREDDTSIAGGPAREGCVVGLFKFSGFLDGRERSVQVAPSLEARIELAEELPALGPSGVRHPHAATRAPEGDAFGFRFGVRGTLVRTDALGDARAGRLFAVSGDCLRRQLEAELGAVGPVGIIGVEVAVGARGLNDAPADVGR